MENLWVLPIPQLEEKLKTLRHAGAFEQVVDSEGKIIHERTHHYLGCTRCLIEGIIKQRRLYS